MRKRPQDEFATAFGGRAAGAEGYKQPENHPDTFFCLAEIARQVQPKLLVLTHLLLWGAAPDELVAEISHLYDGPVRCGFDLAVY